MPSIDSPTAVPRAGLLLGLAGCLLLSACGESASAARQRRLADLAAVTSAEVEHEETFDHGNDFLRVVRQTLQTVDGKSWIKTDDGFLNVIQLRAYHQWNSTEVGRTVPRAIDFESPNHPIGEIVARAEELRSHGVDFLYVVVPSRVELYPELLMPDLPMDADFPGMNPGMVRFLDELVRRGVEVVPLLGPFAAERTGPDGGRWLYCRTLPFWTPRGVVFGAEEISAAVRRFPWFQQGPAREGVDFKILENSIHGQVPPELASLPGYGEPEELPVQAVLNSEGLAAHVADPESPIVLLGDNAVTTYFEVGADLASQIYRRIGTRIDVVSSIVAGQDQSWPTFQRRADALAGKKLVIQVNSAGFRLPATKHAPIEGDG